MIRIGVDTGGTFTDLLCLDDRGLRVYKLRSTPHDPSLAILSGIETLVADTATSTDSFEVTHGSTVATNAVLERKGARVALIATSGFEDVLRIGRQTRPELYNFQVQRPDPLIARELCYGLNERIAADGNIIRELALEEVTALLPSLVAAHVDSVAVCFLHSYANPEHERIVAAELRKAGFRTSVSHEVLPEYREFERWSTTAVNAYVAPLMEKYLSQLLTQLRGNRLRIMQSNGGSISAARASSEAVQTILSGPAAGVIGAQAAGHASGFSQLITFDMGGTSTDVSLLNGAIGTTNESFIGDLPVRLPVIDIHTVGAGGGSIAWVDSGGALRVGPKSAGASPGPVCFGVGHELTVTDANLLLGRLDPDYFLGGRMPLDVSRTKAIAGKVAAQLGLSIRSLALGIVRIANANMERAVRVISVQRGHDPRDFALLAFGGAGGLHACGVAESLEMNTVLVPQHEGVLSAYGMLLADVVKDYSSPLMKPSLSVSPEKLAQSIAQLAQRAITDLHAEGFAGTEINSTASISMRYRGQAFEIDVPVSIDDEVVIPEVVSSFHERHKALYGYSNMQRETEAVQLRLRAIGKTTKPDLPHAQTVAPRALPEPVKQRKVVFDRETLQTPVFHRNRLAAGMRSEGPALIISGESTIVFPPGWMWQVDSADTIIGTTLTPQARKQNLAN